MLKNSEVVASRPVSAYALTSRLDAIDIDADGRACQWSRNSSRSNQAELATPRRQSIDTVGTLTPTEEEATALQMANVAAEYEELRKQGGRPVCSLARWHQWIADPHAAAPGDVDLASWLSQSPPAAGDGVAIIEDLDVFGEQLRQRWAFLRWQAIQRGAPTEGDEQSAAASITTNNTFNPFAAFVAFKTASYERMGLGYAVHQARFMRDMQHAWDILPGPRNPLPDDTMFDTAIGAAADAASGTDVAASTVVLFDVYCQQTVARLASYYLHTPPLALHKDPRQQSPLTTWLEYLAFELDCLEPYLRARARQLPQYNRAWNALSLAAADSPVHNHQDNMLRRPTNFHNSTENEAMNDFLQQTALYRHLDASVQRRQARIQWIVGEARLLGAGSDNSDNLEISISLNATDKGEGTVLLTPREGSGDMRRTIPAEREGTTKRADRGGVFTLLWKAFSGLLDRRLRR